MNQDGAEVYLTTLAIPSLETVEMVNDMVDVYGGFGLAPITQYRGSSSMAMNLKLTTVNRPDNVLCELKVGDKE